MSLTSYRAAPPRDEVHQSGTLMDEGPGRHERPRVCAGVLVVQGPETL